MKKNFKIVAITFVISKGNLRTRLLRYKLDSTDQRRGEVAGFCGNTGDLFRFAESRTFSDPLINNLLFKMYTVSMRFVPVFSWLFSFLCSINLIGTVSTKLN